MEWKVGAIATACGGAAATTAWEFSEHTVFEIVSSELTAHGLDPHNVIAHGSTFVLPSTIFAAALYGAYRLGHHRGRAQRTRQETNPDGLASTNIVINPVPALLRADLRFGLLHVRDGKDEVRDSWPLLNKEILFQKLDERGALVATIQHSPILGCQFKCFLDHAGLTFGQIKPFLEESGFAEVSEGKGKGFRSWFLISGYPPCITVDGFKNNFIYPA